MSCRKNTSSPNSQVFSDGEKLTGFPTHDTFSMTWFGPTGHEALSVSDGQCQFSNSED